MPSPYEALRKAASISADPKAQAFHDAAAEPLTESVAPLGPDDLQGIVSLGKGGKELFAQLLQRLAKGESLEEVPKALREASMGFNKTVYHGTGNKAQVMYGIAPKASTTIPLQGDYPFLNPKVPGRDFGIHVDPDPRVANSAISISSGEKIPSWDTLGNAGENYFRQGRIIPLKARIQNPLDLPDMGTWNEVPSFLHKANPYYRIDQIPIRGFTGGPDFAKGKNPVIQELLEKAKALTRKYPTVAGDPWMMHNFNLSKQEWPEILTETLKKHGHDSIRYLNHVEGVGNPSYLLLDSNQVRVPWAKFDPKRIQAGDLLASIAAGASLPSLMSSHGKDTEDAGR